MKIKQSANKALKQVDFNIHRKGNVSGSGGGSSARLNGTCNMCGKKGHIHKDYRSKGNVSSGNPSKKSTNELPAWVTNKPVVSNTKYLATATMTWNNKKYKCCTSFNYTNGACGFHCKDGNEECKKKQWQKASVFLPIPLPIQ